MTKDNNIITPRQFVEELRRYQKGSVTRRHFLGVTGLGLATAVLGGAMPGLKPRKAYAALSGTVNFTTWPSYFAQENIDKFTKDTGVKINIAVFGSNEEMLAKLQAGSTGWDVFVPTNYAISTYKELGLIEELDLAKLPNYDASTQEQRFTAEGVIDGKTYAVPKDWGTTGFVYNSKSMPQKPASWKEFWDLAMNEATGRAMVHDYQLTTIGNALKYHGSPSTPTTRKSWPRPKAADRRQAASLRHQFRLQALAHARRCLDERVLDRRRHPASARHAGDALCAGKEGGEIWSDFYAIPKGAPNIEAAYALIDFLLTPEINAKEVVAHGYPSTDSRTNKLVPKEMLENPILYPAPRL